MRKDVLKGEPMMKRPLSFTKDLALCLKRVFFVTTLTATASCYGSNDLSDQALEDTTHSLAPRLDINTCAKALGNLIEDLQKKKEGDVYLALRKDNLPASLQGALKITRRGALCTDVRALHVVKQKQLDEETANQINLADNKKQATRAEKILLHQVLNLAEQEKRFLVNGLYAQLGFANKGHFFRIFNENTQAVKSLTQENTYLISLLQGAEELTTVPHREIIEYLYRYPSDILDVQNQASLATIKEALECFFPE